MRKWLPSKKTVGIWISAAALAVLSLPSPPVLPQSGERQPTPAEASPRVGAIPTIASPDVSQPMSDAATDDEASSSQTMSSNATSATTAGSAQDQQAGNQTQKKQTQHGQGTQGGQTQTSPGGQPSQAGQGGAAPAAPRRQNPPAPNAATPPSPNAAGPGAPGAGAQNPQQPGPGTSPTAPGQPTPPQATPGQPTPTAPDVAPNAGTPGLNGAATQPFSPYVAWPTAKLRVRVIDGRTLQPLPDAEVVIIETEQRVKTDKEGYTPYVDAPIIRNPRYRPMVQELHGQLGVIAYKNGYRDSVHLGIRMHEGYRSETTVWMYKLGPGDTRIEPVLYQVPYHHLWLVELADKFRSKTQPGEGPERP